MVNEVRLAKAEIAVRHPDVRTFSAVRAKAIQADGTGDVLGLRFQAIEAAFPQTQVPGPDCIGHLSRHSMSFASHKDRNAEAAKAAPVEVEDRDPVAKYPAPNWRRAWRGGSRSSTTRPRGRSRSTPRPPSGRRLRPLGSGRGPCASGRP